MSGLRIIRWNGDALLRKMVSNVEDAINETTKEAADDASRSHGGWASQTGQLESEVVSEPAQVRGTKVSGRFGTTKTRGFYGLIHEHRTPFLRPAADRQFPQLAKRIAKRVR